MLEPLNGREPGPEMPHLPQPLRLTGETEAPRKQGAALGPEGTRWTRAGIGLPSAAAPWPAAGATCSPNSLSPVQVSVSQLNRYLDCSVSPQIDPGRQRLIKAVLGLPRQDLHRAEGRRRRALGSARSQASPPASHYQTGAGGLVWPCHQDAMQPGWRQGPAGQEGVGPLRWEVCTTPSSQLAGVQMVAVLAGLGG